MIVWIVKEAKEEHRAAIEWLNRNTNDDANFFLIEIHAYKVGDSDPAPKFEVIEKPNDFVKRSKVKSDDKDLKKSHSERLIFWNRFNEIIAERGKPFSIRKATTDCWYNIAIGTSGTHVSIDLVNKDGNINVSIYIKDDKELFDRLFDKKDEIEKQFGSELDWERLDNKKASRIIYTIPGLDFDDHSNYDELMNKTIDIAIKLRDTFKEYL